MKIAIKKYCEKKILPLLKAIFRTVILNFICYFFLSEVIGAGMLDGYYSQFTANLLASVASTILYALWFHWFYTTKTNKVYVLNVKKNSTFDFKNEVKSFFKEECIPFLIIYAIFAALFEIIITVCVFMNTRMHWFLTYIYGFLFPLRIADDTCNLFLSPIISIPALLLFITFPAILSRKRLHKKISR